MSVEATSWALGVPVGGNAKVVLLGLANHAHPDGSEAYPSLNTLSRYAHCDRSTARRNLRRLISGGWVIEDGVGPRGQAKFRLPVTGVAKRHVPRGASAQRGVAPVPPEPSLEPSYTEDTVVSSASRNDDPEIARLSNLLADLIRSNDPKARVMPNSKGWRDAARLLRDRDGRSAEEIERVIRWTQADEFECTVVLSMPKLRERFTSLRAKAERGQGPRALAAVSDTVKRGDAVIHDLMAKRKAERS